MMNGVDKPIQAQSSEEFLRRAFHRQKIRRRGFGIRRLSQELGYRSPAAASMILHGKRKLRLDTLESLSESLGLGHRERRVLTLLVRLGSAKTRSEEFELREKLHELQTPSKGETLKLQQYRFLSEWYYPVVFMLVAQRNFKEDPAWIAQRIGRGITKTQVRRALNDLVSLGLLKRNGKTLVQTSKTFRTPDEIKSVAIQEYHKKMLDMAKSSLELPIQDREFGALTTSIPRDKLPLVKEKIKSFRKELNQLFESTDQGAEVYQFNLQLFPLTGKGRKGNPS